MEDTSCAHAEVARLSSHPPGQLRIDRRMGLECSRTVPMYIQQAERSGRLIHIELRFEECFCILCFRSRACLYDVRAVRYWTRKLIAAPFDVCNGLGNDQLQRFMVANGVMQLQQRVADRFGRGRGDLQANEGRLS